MRRTEISVTATVINEESHLPTSIDNQKVVFSYSNLSAGRNVSMILKEGEINEPKIHIVIDHVELERVLEFLKSAKK